MQQILSLFHLLFVILGFQQDHGFRQHGFFPFGLKFLASLALNSSMACSYGSLNDGREPLTLGKLSPLWPQIRLHMSLQRIAVAGTFPAPAVEELRKV